MTVRHQEDPTRASPKPRHVLIPAHSEQFRSVRCSRICWMMDSRCSFATERTIHEIVLLKSAGAGPTAGSTGCEPRSWEPHGSLERLSRSSAQWLVRSWMVAKCGGQVAKGNALSKSRQGRRGYESSRSTGRAQRLPEKGDGGMQGDDLPASPPRRSRVRVRIPLGQATACSVAQLVEPCETGNEGSSPSGNRCGHHLIG